MQLYGGLDETTDQRSPDSQTPQRHVGGKLFSERRQERTSIQKEHWNEQVHHERKRTNRGELREQEIATEVGQRDCHKLYCQVDPHCLDTSDT